MKNNYLLTGLVTGTLSCFIWSFTMPHKVAFSSIPFADSTKDKQISIADSLERDKINGTIYTKINSEGKIEISRKELEKLPADRQEVLRKDANYKVIEN